MSGLLRLPPVASEADGRMGALVVLPRLLRADSSTTTSVRRAKSPIGIPANTPRKPSSVRPDPRHPVPVASVGVPAVSNGVVTGAARWLVSNGLSAVGLDRAATDGPSGLP